jgi:hypothetical protein
MRDGSHLLDRLWALVMAQGDMMLVFVVLVAGGAVLLEATRMNSCRISRKSACANNQRQIILSAMVYANDNNQLWPCRPTDAHGHATTDPAAIDGFCTAAASLEFLMVCNSGDLTLKLFVCPSNTGTLQYLPNPTQGNSMDYATGVSQWGNNHLPQTPGGPGAMAYAYDWSAPTDTSAIRVMITDRGNLTVAHKTVIMAAAGDGHVETINLTTTDGSPRAPGAHVTMDLDGNPERAVGAAKDASFKAVADDPYDDHDDDGNMQLPGQGSSTRSWVR